MASSTVQGTPSVDKLNEALDGWAKQFEGLDDHADEEALFAAFEKRVTHLKELHDSALEQTKGEPEAQSQIRSQMVEAVQAALVTPEGDGTQAGKGALANMLGIRRREKGEDEKTTETEQSFESVAHTKSLRSHLKNKQADKALVNSLKGVLEFDGSAVKYTLHYDFENWGKTVSNDPQLVFEPRTVTGVQNIVKWSISRQKSVRCSGFRHTWANMYSSNDNVLVSMIPVSIATDTCTLLQRPPLPATPTPDGLSFVKVQNDGKKTADNKTLIKIGASTTNDEFRQWCLSDDGGKWLYTLPLNVIMVEITFGGSNAPICHGAGIKHETLSDLVHSIEFINPLGELQVVDDPDLLKTAAGAFGLMGVVTAVTLKIDDMEYAEMAPNFTPVPTSIPPMNVSDVPDALKKGWNPANLEKDIAIFEEHCAKDYYAEWFWFSLQEKTWNNCWQTKQPNGDYRKDSQILSHFSSFSESFLGIIAEATNKLIGMSGWLQTKLMGLGASMTLPNVKPGETRLTPVIDALHFRRGIHNMRVVDMELEIELPLTKEGTTDWSICRRAWWDVIKLVYKYKKDRQYPMRLALEMRVMGGSGILMAPQYGNTNGTCSIEVLSSTQTPVEQWQTFMQEVSDLWHKYTHPDGTPLTVRSHWAKQWESLTFGPNKVPAVKHFRDTLYRDQITQFKDRLVKIAAAYTSPTGETYTIDHLQRSFSTPLLNDLFFTAPETSLKN